MPTTLTPVFSAKIETINKGLVSAPASHSRRVKWQWLVGVNDAPVLAAADVGLADLLIGQVTPHLASARNPVRTTLEAKHTFPWFGGTNLLSLAWICILWQSTQNYYSPYARLDPRLSFRYVWVNCVGELLWSHIARQAGLCQRKLRVSAPRQFLFSAIYSVFEPLQLAAARLVRKYSPMESATL